MIDDYGTFPGAWRATDDYRLRAGEAAPLRWIDHAARYRRKGTTSGFTLYYQHGGGPATP